MYAVRLDLDFITEKGMRVFNETYTDSYPINAAVPQGSLLASTLFVLHINLAYCRLIGKAFSYR